MVQGIRDYLDCHCGLIHRPYPPDLLWRKGMYLNQYHLSPLDFARGDKSQSKYSLITIKKIFLALFIGLCVVTNQGIGQVISTQGSTANADSSLSLDLFIRRHLAELAPKGYIQQQKIKNLYHRNRYTEILFAASGGDGLMAILSYLKMEMNIEFALLHREFVTIRF